MFCKPITTINPNFKNTVHVTKTLNFSSKFFKAQVSSLTATSVDFSITYILTSVVGVLYIFSSAGGVICGGIINFVLGRYWVFNANNERRVKQIPRYMIIWISSMFLNMGGIIFLTETFGFYYLVSKVITSILVGIFFNYYLQREFVFKTTNSI